MPGNNQKKDISKDAVDVLEFFVEECTSISSDLNKMAKILQKIESLPQRHRIVYLKVLNAMEVVFETIKANAKHYNEFFSMALTAWNLQKDIKEKFKAEQSAWYLDYKNFRRKLQQRKERLEEGLEEIKSDEEGLKEIAEALDQDNDTDTGISELEDVYRMMSKTYKGLEKVLPIPLKGYFASLDQGQTADMAALKDAENVKSDILQTAVYTNSTLEHFNGRLRKMFKQERKLLNPEPVEQLFELLNQRLEEIVNEAIKIIRNARVGISQHEQRPNEDQISIFAEIKNELSRGTLLFKNLHQSLASFIVPEFSSVGFSANSPANLLPSVEGFFTQQREYYSDYEESKKELLLSIKAVEKRIAARNSKEIVAIKEQIIEKAKLAFEDITSKIEKVESLVQQGILIINPIYQKMQSIQDAHAQIKWLDSNITEHEEYFLLLVSSMTNLPQDTEEKLKSSQTAWKRYAATMMNALEKIVVSNALQLNEQIASLLTQQAAEAGGIIKNLGEYTTFIEKCESSTAIARKQLVKLNEISTMINRFVFLHKKNLSDVLRWAQIISKITQKEYPNLQKILDVQYQDFLLYMEHVNSLLMRINAIKKRIGVAVISNAQVTNNEEIAPALIAALAADKKRQQAGRPLLTSGMLRFTLNYPPPAESSALITVPVAAPESNETKFLIARKS